MKYIAILVKEIPNVAKPFYVLEKFFTKDEVFGIRHQVVSYLQDENGLVDEEKLLQNFNDYFCLWEIIEDPNAKNGKGYVRAIIDMPFEDGPDLQQIVDALVDSGDGFISSITPRKARTQVTSTPGRLPHDLGQ